MADDLDDLTQSSDTATEELDSPSSGYRHASQLIQKLDSTSIGKTGSLGTSMNSVFKTHTHTHHALCTLHPHHTHSFLTHPFSLFFSISLSAEDSVSMVKLQNMFQEYEHTIQRERSRHSRLAEKMSQLEQERTELRLVLEETRDSQSNLVHLKMELETELNNLRSAIAPSYTSTVSLVF